MFNLDVLERDHSAKHVQCIPGRSLECCNGRRKHTVCKYAAFLPHLKLWWSFLSESYIVCRYSNPTHSLLSWVLGLI